MNIRNFNIETDYTPVMELWQSCHLSYKPEGRDSYENLEKELRRGCADFFVAEDDGSIIATVLATNDGRKGWINRVAVHPDYRRKEIARKLVAHAENAIYNKGIEIIALLVEGDNEDSFHTFSKLGYEDFQGIHYMTKRRYPEV